MIEPQARILRTEKGTRAAPRPLSNRGGGAFALFTSPRVRGGVAPQARVGGVAALLSPADSVPHQTLSRKPREGENAQEVPMPAERFDFRSAENTAPGTVVVRET